MLSLDKSSISNNVQLVAIFMLTKNLPQMFNWRQSKC